MSESPVTGGREDVTRALAEHFPIGITEDVADGSMCVCGIPALSHDAVMADAPADTALRDQMLAVIHKAQWGDTRPGVVTANDARIADALLPLLRAHDAQVAAQAWSEGSQAATAWINQTTRVAPVNPYRAAAPQPARDQAHDET